MKLNLAAAALAFALAGCSSGSNQKITSPFLGWCHNEWTVVYVSAESLEDAAAVSNKLVQAASRVVAASSTNSIREAASSKTGRSALSFGSGAEMMATIDNQVLVGRDIGNATSNAVSGSASVPVTF